MSGPLTNTARALNPWDVRSTLSNGTLGNAELKSLESSTTAGARHVAENVGCFFAAGTPVGYGLSGYHLTQSAAAGKRAFDAYRAGADAAIVKKEIVQAVDHAAAGVASAVPGGQAYFLARGAVQGGFLANSIVISVRHLGQVLSALT